MATIRVLVIDDSVTIRAVLEQLIGNDRECEVGGIVSDAVAARDRVGSGAIDVITLDLAMPGIDGLRFLDELANRHHAPVVVVSSSTREGTAACDEALARGADACFDKARIMSDTAGFMAVLKAAARNRKRQHPPLEGAPEDGAESDGASREDAAPQDAETGAADDIPFDDAAPPATGTDEPFHAGGAQEGRRPFAARPIAQDAPPHAPLSGGVRAVDPASLPRVLTFPAVGRADLPYRESIR